MRLSRKPVRKCHSCLLNLVDHCWLYEYPRGQWRGHKECRAKDDPETQRRFRAWQKQPVVKSRKELRREYFRGRPRCLREPGDRPKGE
jgi:hypothetical protein